MNAVLILITETDCKESSGTYCIQAPVVTDTVCYGRVGTLIEVFRRKLQSCLAADAVDRVVVQLNRALNQDSDTHCIEAVGGHRLRRCAWEEELPLVGARATGRAPTPAVPVTSPSKLIVAVLAVVSMSMEAFGLKSMLATTLRTSCVQVRDAVIC